MSRRGQKKCKTFGTIVDSAAALFDTVGYEATAMEAIAHDADVSVGTVYNYFGTKNAILATIITLQVDEILDHAGGALNLAAHNPVGALMPMLDVYLDRMTDYGPGLLKEVFRAGFEPAQSDLLADFVSADERVVLQLADALHCMQSEGLVGESVDTAEAALLIYSTVAIALMMFVAVPEMTSEQVKAVCRAQLALAFAGLGSGHESASR